MEKFKNIGNPIMNSFDEKITEHLWDKYVGFGIEEAIITRIQFEELIAYSTGEAEQRVIDSQNSQEAKKDE